MDYDQVLQTVRPNAKTVYNVLEDAEGPAGAKRISVTVESKPPVRTESPKRQHHFHTCKALLDYVKVYGGKDTVIYVGQTQIVAVLDEKSASQFELLTFIPQMHPIFAVWRAVHGRAMSIKELAAFVQAQRQNIVEPKGALLAGRLRQVKASTKIELHAGSGNDAVNGILIQAKIQGKDVGQDVDLPEVLEVRTPVYMDTDETDLAFDLTLQASPDGTMVVALITMPTLDVELFETMETYATALKDAPGLVVRGQPVHADWKYQPPAVL